MSQPKPRRVNDVLGRLYVTYHETNEQHFAGLLPLLPLHLDPALGRGPKATLASVSIDRNGRPWRINIASQHVLRNSWWSVRDTLLHEIVHVWQCLIGDDDMAHNANFRRMARRVGCKARAVSPKDSK